MRSKPSIFEHKKGLYYKKGNIQKIKESICIVYFFFDGNKI